jgi:hypothetical protein
VHENFPFCGTSSNVTISCYSLSWVHFSADQEVCHFHWTQRFNIMFKNSSPLDLILSQLNPIYTLISCFSTIPSMPRSPKYSYLHISWPKFYTNFSFLWCILQAKSAYYVSLFLRSKYSPLLFALKQPQTMFSPYSRGSNYTLIKSSSKIILLCILILDFLIGHWKIKGSELKGSKHIKCYFSLSLMQTPS